jgi:hypothetical protein
MALGLRHAVPLELHKGAVIGRHGSWEKDGGPCVSTVGRYDTAFYMSSERNQRRGS